MATTEAGRAGGARPIGFWLVPAGPFHGRLTAVIARLAREQGAVPFEPHVTLYAGVRTDDDDVEALLGAAAAATEALELVCGATGHSEALFKTLFVELDDPRLPPLSRRLRDALSRPVAYVLQPHLSLLYRQLPPAVRGELARRHTFHGERIRFDQLAAVVPGGGREDWSDIAGWDVVARRPLRQ